MLVRRFESADQDEAVDLFRRFMEEVAPADNADSYLAYVETAVRLELANIEEYYLTQSGNTFLVADSDGVVGMVGVERQDAGTAELRRMIVDKPARREGIGRSLLRRAEAFCASVGYDRIVLNTSELQTAARDFYESKGYRMVDRRVAATPSHKSVGAGLIQYYYCKSMIR